MATKRQSNQAKAQDFYQSITTSLVAQIEAGATNWSKCWTGTDGVPHNPATGTAYKGMNFLYLSIIESVNGWGDNRWGTFNNIKKAGGNVRKGEKSTKVMFWKPIMKKNEDTDETECVGFYNKIWSLFNYAQCDGMPELVEGEKPTTGSLIGTAQKYLEGEESISIKFGGNRACYNPKSDLIKMPHQSSFTSDAEFTSTLFHEIAHSTGHASRLSREGVTNLSFFGSHSYSFEELVAEFTAVFMSAQLGVIEEGDKCFNNSAAYLRSWIGKLKDNPDWAARAAQKAQKACELILSHSVKADKEEAA